MIYLVTLVLLAAGFLALLYHLAPEMYAALVRGARTAVSDGLRFLADKVGVKP